MDIFALLLILEEKQFSPTIGFLLTVGWGSSLGFLSFFFFFKVIWQRSLLAYSPWGRWELDTTQWLQFHFSLSYIGEGNGNPLQCSCLENPRDKGAWWAAVYGVAQSWTWLKRLSSSSSSIVNQWWTLSKLFALIYIVMWLLFPLSINTVDSLLGYWTSFASLE